MAHRATLVNSYGGSNNFARWMVSPLVVAFIALNLQTCLTSVEALALNYTQMSIDQIILQEIQSTNVSGRLNDPSVVRVDLDILFPADDWLALLRNESDSDNSARRKRRKARKGQALRWPNAEVPYTIAASFSSRDIAVFTQAIADYHKYTCVRFRETRPGDRDYLRVVDVNGCSSYAGRQGGMQDLSLSIRCRQKGVIIHELGHAIGFVHEHSRPDRDQYVRINKKNLFAENQHDFVKYGSTFVHTDITPYDYLSIMHYGQYTASNNGHTVIETTDRNYQTLIGQRNGLSFRDVKLVNIIYRCSEEPMRRCRRKKVCPGEGFVGQDCQCWCPSGNTEIAAVPCPGCLDFDDYCLIFQQHRGFCTKRLFRDYMKEMCPRSCGYCS